MSGWRGSFWAASLIVLSAVLCGCQPSTSNPPATVQYEPAIDMGTPGPPTVDGQQTPAGQMPSVQVHGDGASYEFGPVQPGSTHFVTFVVDNPTDRALRLKTVRGDCECISAVNPPTQIAPHGSANILVRYEASQRPRDYESRVVIATDDPGRRLISLRVTSKAPLR